MANAFTKAQFMEAPGGAASPVPIGAVKAGAGITISADGTISTAAGGGTINDIVATNGLQGGGQGPQVFLGMLPPTSTTIGGVRTLPGTGISIDSDGIIRNVNQTSITGGRGISVNNLGAGSFVINQTAAGQIPSGLGGVYVPATSGLSVGFDGGLSVAPPSGGGLGGVKAGDGISISSDGTISTVGAGTITGVGAGTGLGGGGSLGAVTLFLEPAQSNVIGGIYPGDGCSVDPDGRLNIDPSAIGVATVSGNAPVYITGTQANPAVNVQTATTASLGVVRPDGVTVLIGPDGIISATNGGGGGGVSSVTVNAPLTDGGSAVAPNISVSVATSATTGVVQPDGTTILVDPAGVISADTPGLQAVTGAGSTTTNAITVGSLTAAGLKYPVTDGANGTVLTTDGVGNITFQPMVAAGALLTTGGTMSGDIVFAGTQSFPGVVNDTSFLASGDILVGTGAGTYANLPQGSNGQVLTVSGGAVTWQNPGAGSYLELSGGTMTGDITFAGTQSFPGVLPLSGGTLTGNLTFNAGQTFPGVLPLSGGTMTGTISFAAGQTISGYVANSLYASTGALTYASGANTPATLNVGANGNILGVNAGLPAWRTAAQLGLLTSAAASSTYATIDSPTFTGPATINGGGAAGANALTVSGGNLVLSTQYTPPSSSSTGSVGELAWDNAGYLYFCYAANTWGRVQIDLTPF